MRGQEKKSKTTNTSINKCGKQLIILGIYLICWFINVVIFVLCHVLVYILNEIGVHCRGMMDDVRGGEITVRFILVTDEVSGLRLDLCKQLDGHY